MIQKKIFKLIPHPPTQQSVANHECKIFYISWEAEKKARKERENDEVKELAERIYQTLQMPRL